MPRLESCCWSLFWLSLACVAAPAPRADGLPWGVAAQGPRATRGWASHSRSPSEPDRASPVLPGCHIWKRPLSRIARTIAESLAAGREAPSPAEVVARSRALGVPHPWPRTWSVAGEALDAEAAAGRFQAWWGRQRFSGQPRCGAARASGRAGQALAVVVVDAIADLEPFPLQARLGQWLTLEARIAVEPGGTASEPIDRVVLLGPRGQPRELAVRRARGRVRSTFSLDQPGPWRVQLVASVPGGPRPALETWTFVDREPGLAPELWSAPGLDATSASELPVSDRERLLRMVNAARHSEGLVALRRDPELDRIAQAHAESMRRRRSTAHDVGLGSPRSRIAELGGSVVAVGENVARAGDLEGAHQALWNSPSHRANLLSSAFRAVGLGVAELVIMEPESRSSKREVWVCQLFVDYGSVLTKRSNVR